MNYYNPYLFNMTNTNPGIFSRIFGNFNLSSILSKTNKALNFVNQTIPVIKQISPMVKNAKTMFNVVNQFRKVDENNDKTEKNIETKKIDKEINQPSFFI